MNPARTKRTADRMITSSPINCIPAQAANLFANECFDAFAASETQRNWSALRLNFERKVKKRTTEFLQRDEFSCPRYCARILSKTKLITIRQLSDLFQQCEKLATRRHVRCSL